MVETIFTSPFALNAVLPFLLVFVLVFAILQKTEILGKGKKQIDALIGLVVGLIVISFANAVDIISRLIPFMAVALVIILIFMLLLGSLFKAGEFEMPKWLKVVIGIIVFISLAIAVLYITGAWDSLAERFSGDAGSGVLTNAIFIIIIAAVGAAFWFGEGKKEK